MLCYTLPPYLWQAVLPSACREMNYPMLCLTNNFAASYRCHVVLIRATAFYIMLVSSSYIRIGNQLTKCNVDDSKRIKAKEIKLQFCTKYALYIHNKFFALHNTKDEYQPRCQWYRHNLSPPTSNSNSNNVNIEDLHAGSNFRQTILCGAIMGV